MPLKAFAIGLGCQHRLKNFGRCLHAEFHAMVRPYSPCESRRLSFQVPAGLADELWPGRRLVRQGFARSGDLDGYGHQGDAVSELSD